MILCFYLPNFAFMTDTITQNDTITWQEFYTRLGYLYYGIASAAGPVDTDGMELLKKCVSRIWMHNSGDLVGFEGYVPNKVDALFDWLNLNETDWEYCVNEFTYFVNKHRADMPEHMRSFALDSADEVARFWGMPNNKAIEKLHTLLGAY